MSETAQVTSSEDRLTPPHLKAEYDIFVEEWTERADTIHARKEQRPSVIQGGRGLHFQELTIYHGSTVSDIKDMQPAEDHTIGQGVYSTYNPNDGAIGYALHRARLASHKPETSIVDPVLYEITAKDVNLLDLRGKNVFEEFKAEFRDFLESWIKKEESTIDEDSHWLSWAYINKARGVVNAIDTQDASARFLKYIAVPNVFNLYIEKLGYQGIVGKEGGEGEIGEHESWVLFSSTHVEVTGETSFVDPNPSEPPSHEPSEAGVNWWEDTKSNPDN